MCNWCNKETRLIPQVSGAKIPMICEGCGTHKGWYDYKQLRERLDKAEGVTPRKKLTRKQSIDRLLRRAK